MWGLAIGVIIGNYLCVGFGVSTVAMAFEHSYYMLATLGMVSLCDYMENRS